MDFLKNRRRIAFSYGGTPFERCGARTEEQEEGNTLTTVYTFPDGLKVTNIAKKYADFGAYEWVNHLENTGSEDSQIISRLFDCDLTLPFPEDGPALPPAYLNPPETLFQVYCPHGSDWSGEEFACDTGRAAGGRFKNSFFPGESKEWKPSGGRSSSGSCAPFFNLHKAGIGAIVAIGWTGQWLCRIERQKDGARILTGIEDSHFRLHPGERIRTSSVVVMPYEGTLTESQNRWRRFLKVHFCPIGKEGMPEQAPFCAGIWGGMSTEGAIRRVKILKDLPVEYIWMDAGWYGDDPAPSPNEFEGNWYESTGDWTVNPHHHPDGLRELAAEIRKAGKKFLLWFEPERAIRGTRTATAHPEYFLDAHPDWSNLLLNLGDQGAWDYAFGMLSEMIGTLGISCYRQDFNMAPLAYFRAADAEDRQGITEIKHIMGLYRLWDALREKFPGLLIDNCASGGRRLDVETLRRSIPLWRSDVTCPANFLTSFVQSHTIAFSAWMPYSGCGCGRDFFDLYRFRSCYGTSLTANFSFWESDPFGEDPEEIEWLRRYSEEYLKARPFYSGDVYPLTAPSEAEDVWSAVQFELPEERRGIVQVFRRSRAPYSAASFVFGGLQKGKTYAFTDADDGRQWEIPAEALEKDGFCLTIPEKRTAKLFFYEIR